jgi:hypothetical protein
MKKFLFATLSLLLIVSCSKDEVNKSNEGLFPSVLSKLYGYELNEEGVIIHDALVASSSMGGIINNNAFAIPTALKLNGSFGGATAVTINGTEYTDGGSTDFLLYNNSNLNLEQYYGLNLTVEVAGSEISFYSPEAIQVPAINGNNLILDGNAPQVVEWNADPNNPLGKIVIQYFIYNQVNGEQGSLIKEDVILIDDNGSFDISSLYSELGEEPKSIDLYYYRGNGRKMPYINGSDEYFFFTCVSGDFNNYNFVY